MSNDPLTGLNDRPSFLALLKRQCEQSINTGSTLGILVVDVLRFRKINWAFGYRAGDAVLTRVAEILGEVCRKRDLIARIGDNEFAMVLPGIMNAGHAVLAATKLLRSLEVPVTVHEHEIKVAATVGLAVCPDHGNNGDVLLRQAEQAVIIARDTGAPYAVARTEKRRQSSSSLDIEFGLQTAVSGGELELFYQPKFHTRKKAPVGSEALIRWNKPGHGRIPPDAFIPVAEESGMIMGITQWALNTALREAKEWPERWGEFSVAVNLSPRVLNEPTLVDLLRGSLEIWETKATSLVLEVTESSAMSDPESVFGVFRQIKKLGARVSLDDFGTGYSSLAHFKEIPADELKLDKSFVQDMVDSPADRHIAKLVIDLAHAFGLSVVAEGVEDAETYKLLAQMGCDYAQGFFIARPMPQADYCDWLARYDGLTPTGPRLAAKAPA